MPCPRHQAAHHPRHPPGPFARPGEEVLRLLPGHPARRTRPPTRSRRRRRGTPNAASAWSGRTPRSNNSWRPVPPACTSTSSTAPPPPSTWSRPCIATASCAARQYRCNNCLKALNKEHRALSHPEGVARFKPRVAQLPGEKSALYFFNPEGVALRVPFRAEKTPVYLLACLSDQALKSACTQEKGCFNKLLP